MIADITRHALSLALSRSRSLALSPSRPHSRALSLALCLSLSRSLALSLEQVGKATILQIMGEAATRQENLEEMIEKQNIEALDKAAVCAILAPAGPERSRILAMLYKDERTQKIKNFTMMEKIYMERVVKPKP